MYVEVYSEIISSTNFGESYLIRTRLPLIWSAMSVMASLLERDILLQRIECVLMVNVMEERRMEGMLSCELVNKFKNHTFGVVGSNPDVIRSPDSEQRTDNTQCEKRMDKFGISRRLWTCSYNVLKILCLAKSASFTSSGKASPR